MEQESVVAGESLVGGLAKGSASKAEVDTMSLACTEDEDERLAAGDQQIKVVKTPTKRRLAGNDDSQELSVAALTATLETAGDERNDPDHNGAVQQIPEEPSSSATASEGTHSMATPPKKGRIAASGGRKVQKDRPLVVEDETGARFVVPAEPPKNTDGRVLRSVENRCPGTPEHNLKSPSSAKAAGIGASDAHDGDEGTADGRQQQGSARRRGRPRKNRLPGDETPGNGRAASEPFRNSGTEQSRETSRGRSPAGERGGRGRHSDGLFNGSDADDDSDDQPRFLTPIRPQESRKRRSSNRAGSDENEARSTTPGRQPLYMVPYFSRDVVPVEKMKQLNASIDSFLRGLDDDDVPCFQPSTWVLEKGDLTVQGVSFQELRRRMKAEKNGPSIRQSVPKSFVSQKESVGDVDEQLSENIGIMSVSTDMVGGGTPKEGADAEMTNISLFDVTPDGIICSEENDPAESSGGKENQ